MCLHPPLAPHTLSLFEYYLNLEMMRENVRVLLVLLLHHMCNTD